MRSLVSIVLAASLSSCIGYEPSEFREPQHLSLALTEQFSYQRATPKYSELDNEKKGNYTKRRVQLWYAATSQNEFPTSINLHWYHPQTEKPVPVILCLPLLNNSFNFEHRCASYFAEKGYAGLIIHTLDRETSVATGRQLSRIFEESVHDHKRVIDWVETRQEFNGDIGIFGASAGGIKATIITALEPRIDAAVIALAGADIPDIIQHSSLSLIKKKTKDAREHDHLAQEQWYSKMREELTLDPKYVASSINPEKVLFVQALFDSIVPTRNQEQLYRLMGNPERELFLSGHLTPLFFPGYIESRSHSFFKKKFNSEK